MRSWLVVAIVGILLAPAAAAQEPLEPLSRHVDEKAASAQKDPTRFVGDHASADGAQKESAWVVGYTCYVVDTAEREIDGPRVMPEACDDYEEAIGIEEEEEPMEDVVAIAENDTEEAVADAKELAEDAIATAEEVLRDPASAPARAVSLAERIAGFVERRLQDLLDLVGATIAEADAAGRAIFEARIAVVGGIVMGVGAGAGAVADGVVASAQGLGAVISDLVEGMAEGTREAGAGVAKAAAAATDFVGDVVEGTVKGLESGAKGVGEAAAAAADGVSDAVSTAARSIGSFFGSLGRIGSDPAPRPSDGPAGDATDRVTDLLDDLPVVDHLA